MKNRVCVVTGGNTGIGKAIVLALAQQQMQVAMVSRNKERGQTAVQDLLVTAPDAAIDLVVGDVGTIASTRQLAQDLLDRYANIHILINNAGIWPTKRILNEDGLEQSFMVNYLAPFMLDHLLYNRLKASAPARIVNVSAGLYVNGNVDLNKTPYGLDFHPIRTYANTKLCSVLTLPLEAEWLNGSGITINAVHPGVIRTNLGIMPGPVGWFIGLVKRSWGTPERGAAAPVWLATAPELSTMSGKYFNEKEKQPLAEVAQNLEQAKSLWQLSAELTGLPV